MKKILLILTSLTLLFGCQKSVQSAQTRYSSLPQENAFETIDNERYQSVLAHGTGIVFIDAKQAVNELEARVIDLNTIVQEEQAKILYYVYNSPSDLPTTSVKEVDLPLLLFISQGEIINSLKISEYNAATIQENCAIIVQKQRENDAQGCSLECDG